MLAVAASFVRLGPSEPVPLLGTCKTVLQERSHPVSLGTASKGLTCAGMLELPFPMQRKQTACKDLREEKMTPACGD